MEDENKTFRKANLSFDEVGSKEKCIFQNIAHFKD